MPIGEAMRLLERLLRFEDLLLGKPVLCDVLKKAK